MKVALISLSKEGAALISYLKKALPEGEVFLHRQVESELPARRFDSIMTLTKEIFFQYEGLIYVMPAGVAVRSLAPHLHHKTQDPAAVVVDVGGRFAISLLSGHEGGANDLALLVGNILGAEPVITTSTEALKSVIVGIGCRRGDRGGSNQGSRAGRLEGNCRRESTRFVTWLRLTSRPMKKALLKRPKRWRFPCGLSLPRRYAQPSKPLNTRSL